MVEQCTGMPVHVDTAYDTFMNGIIASLDVLFYAF